MFTVPSVHGLKEAPDHLDADLVMKLYDLRRDPAMREARALVNRTFFPKSAEDVVAPTKHDHPLNVPLRQTSTYWEMAYGMVKHGILHAEYMLESNGEGMVLFARIQPWLAEYRAASGSARNFMNAEWVATHTEAGRAIFDLQRARLARMMEQR